MGRDPSRVMVLYWGRRGLTQFTYELARAALANSRYEVTISLSRQNENFTKFEEFGSAIFPIDTFATNGGAVTQAWKLLQLRKQLIERLRKDRTQAVIELMPHVWYPLLLPAVHAIGVRSTTLVHDANPHPGDYRTWWVKRILDRSASASDLVLTMKKS
jgi:hypothetical protein